jgi:integrase
MSKSDNSIARSSPRPRPRGPHAFSAKLPPGRRPAPSRKQKRSPSVRDYLRPEEVEAMIQAARKTGRHPVRDAAIILMMVRHGLRTAELVALRWHQVDLKAGGTWMSTGRSAGTMPHTRYAGRNYASCGNCSAPILTHPMCSSPSAKRPCPHGRFAQLWREQAGWPGSPLCPIPTSSGVRAAIIWRLGGMIPGPFRIIWGIRTFSIPCATPPWRLTDSKASGMIKP